MKLNKQKKKKKKKKKMGGWQCKYNLKSGRKREVRVKGTQKKNKKKIIGGKSCLLAFRE